MILDSLKIVVEKLYANSVNPEQDTSFLTKRELYIKLMNEYEEQNQALVSEFTKQSLNQLNEYINEFGKEYQYDIIYGANGNGSFLYIDENYDITDEVTKYVNQKYSGL